MTSAHPESRSRLEQLAALYGIAIEFDDVSGQRRVASDATLIALLAEFDVDASTPEHVEAAWHAALAAGWREPLPPVAAVAAGATPWKLRLRLDASVCTLRWTLEEENSARHDGVAEASALATTAQAEFDGLSFRECELVFAFALPAGYHTLTIDGLPGKTLVVAAPAHCYRIPQLGDSGRVWGPAVQLYALRSEHNWGIGDFGDLARLVETWGERGAGIIGLNPLHALFPHNPAHASPYSPSSRSRLNVLYIDVEALEDLRECEAAQRRVRSAEFQARLASLRAVPLIDHRGVAAAKFEILELLYAHFRERHLALQSERAREFQAFCERGGEALRQHALFEAIQAYLHATDASVWGWPVWPIEYRDHASVAAQAFERAHLERVEWYEYLQWQAERQLARASASCQARGLAVGLYLDLAVSVDRAGSDTWMQREIFAVAASVGAPPDAMNLNGQGWGLPPLRPDRQRASAYRGFVSTLRENMRYAGALRIDHVMGLMRLFWIPADKTASDGAYVHYRLDEMLAIVALESERNRCMVIGEDLGTVADEVRAALARYEVLSYRLLYFERREGGEFKPSAEYPRDALVTVSTHDLPTLAGWWQGDDLRLRLALKLYPNEASYEKQFVDRSQDRMRLLLALRRADLLPPGITVELTAPQELTPALVDAIHAFVAAAPSRVMVMQIEDALGMVEQANLPGTTEEHPNWRRKRACRSPHADARARASTSGAPRVRNAHASARGARAACHLSLAVSQGLWLRRRGGGAALPGAARRQPCLLFADPACAGGQPARLRHRCARRDQSGARRQRGFRPFQRRASPARHGAIAGHGAQPHGCARGGQRLVDGRARERARVAVRAAFRHRLATGRPRPAWQSPGAGARRALRRRTRQRRAGPGLRGQWRFLCVALSRAPVSDRPAQLCAAARARRGAYR
jgi:(1->4)-alpha-D-glucan 1-alpha-D-glucosylmutase